MLYLEIQLVLLPLSLTVRFGERVLSPEGHTAFVNTTSVPPVATSWEDKGLPSMHILYFSVCLSTHLQRWCTKVGKHSSLVACRNPVRNWVPRRTWSAEGTGCNAVSGSGTTHHTNSVLNEIGIVGGGVQLGPLGTAAINGLLCQPRVIMMMEKLVEWLAGETEVLGENLSLCPPQTPHAARTRTRAAAVGSQRLTAWATARPHQFRSFCGGESGLNFCSRSICIQLHALFTRELFHIESVEGTTPIGEMAV
jgi:hypothetical protein